MSFRARPLLSAILLVALSFHLMLAVKLSHRGLPYLYTSHVDEPALVGVALEILKTGDWEPRLFFYGSPIIYLHTALHSAVFLMMSARPPWVAETISSTSQIVSGLQRKKEPSHPSFYLASRILTAILGSSAMVVLYLFGRLLGGGLLGLSSLVMLALTPPFVWHSSIANPNIPVILTYLLGSLFLLRYHNASTLKDLYLAVIFFSLAPAIKINAIVSLLAPSLYIATTSLRELKPELKSHLILLLLVPFLVFVSVSPYSILALPHFLNDLAIQVKSYHLDGYYKTSESVNAGLPLVKEYYSLLSAHFGHLWLIPTTLGLLLCGKKEYRFLLVILCPPTVHFFWICNSEVRHIRHVLFLFPWICVLWSMCLAKGGLLITPSRQGMSARILTVTLVTLLSIPCINFLKSSVNEYKKLLNISLKDNRTLAIEEIGARSPTTFAALELAIHPIDLKRAQSTIRQLPLENILGCPPQIDFNSYLLIPRSIEQERYEKSRLGLEKIKTILRDLEKNAFWMKSGHPVSLGKAKKPQLHPPSLMLVRAKYLDCRR